MAKETVKQDIQEHMKIEGDKHGHFEGIRNILHLIKDKILSCIDPFFEKKSRRMTKTLYEKGLNPREEAIIEQGIKDKYTPALRTSALLALAASPGVLVNDISAVQYVLAVVSSITGIAWFAMSLKEVKEKFIDFGVELTSDMLKAFLTTVLIIAITSGYGLASKELATVVAWAREAGIDIKEIFNSRVFRTSSTAVALLAGTKIFGWLIKAVVKFDVNDSLLTGSSDLAKKFYERSLSSLRAAAAVLKDEHDLQAANYQIGVALNHYYEFLIKINADLPEGLNEDFISKLTMEVTEEQKKFDEMIIPILRNMLKQYEQFIGKDEALIHRYKFTMESIDALERLYSTEKGPAQSLADNTIATTLEHISEFLEIFQDELGGQKETKELAA